MSEQKKNLGSHPPSKVSGKGLHLPKKKNRTKNKNSHLVFLCPSQHQNSPTHVHPFFPESTDLSLKCEDSKALSLQTCDFFQKISRSNLWLTDPWQLQISLFLSLLALHLVEKLSDSHLHWAAQVFIMSAHRISYMVHTSKAAAVGTHAAHRDPCTAAIYPAAFLIFIAQNPPHLLFFLDDVYTLRGTQVWPLYSDTLSPPCLRFKTTQFYSENYAQSTPLSGQMGDKHLHLRHCAATNAETMWLW